jgi:HEPN domain-containing protein
LYTGTLKALPPKTHNLIYLTEKISLELPTELNEFLQRLNLESVATRYPDDLQKSIKEYSRKRTAGILKKSKQVLKWLKAR